jgi:gamma-glutamyl-gamma-aminobutyrate hydrolase PuuD
MTAPKPEPEVVAAQPRPIIKFRDHILDYPELYLDVYIGEREDEAQFATMFARSWCTRVDEPDKADLVVFTGGADVNPNLYGVKEVHGMTKFDKLRDDRDMVLYADCYLAGIPMLGICRGAQFLHVMNGGKLFQHTDSHVGDHSMLDPKTGVVIAKVSSTHHQMCIQNNRMEVLGTAPGKSVNRWTHPGVRDTGECNDIEAFYYADTACIGFQGHPEFQNYGTYTVWCLKKIQEIFQGDPHITSDNDSKKYRIKKELLIEREALGEK